MNRIFRIIKSSLLRRVIISIAVLFLTLLVSFWTVTGAFLWKPFSLLNFLTTFSIFCFLPWMDFLFPSEAMEVVLVALRSDRNWISTMSLLLSRSLPPVGPTGGRRRKSSSTPGERRAPEKANRGDRADQSGARRSGAPHPRGPGRGSSSAGGMVRLSARTLWRIFSIKGWRGGEWQNAISYQRSPF